MKKPAKKRKQGGRGAPLTSEKARELIRARWAQGQVAVPSGRASLQGSVARVEGPGDPSGVGQGERPDIIQFTTDPAYLGLQISMPQRALLKASYGMPLDPEELEVFRLCTGRTVDPRTAFRVVVAIEGARAGKDSRLVAPACLYEARFGGHAIAKGETARIALFAQDSSAAGVTYDYIRDYLLGSPALKGLVKGTPLRSSIRLKNHFEIRTYAATAKTARAYSVPCAVLNEAAFFRFAGSVNADTEILASVRRGMLNFANPKLFIVSTPYAKSGIVYEHFTKYYGRDDSLDVLVWRAPSALMNPSISMERLAEEQRLMDPQQFQREFNAEFVDDAAAWLPGELIEAAIDQGVTERPPQPGVRYTMAIDASGAGKCGFAVSVLHEETQGELRTAIQDVAQVWMKPPSGTLNLPAIAREIIALGARYGCLSAYSDRYAGQWPAQTFAEHSSGRFTLKDPQAKRAGDLVYLHKSDALLETAPLFRTGAIRLLDVPAQTRELRNLEARPMEGGRMRISKPAIRSETDDMATALATAAAMLMAKSTGWAPFTISFGTSTAERAQAFWERQQKGRISPVTTGRNEADEYRRHLIRCQDPRVCNHHPAHNRDLATLPAAPPQRMTRGDWSQVHPHERPGN